MKKRPNGPDWDALAQQMREQRLVLGLSKTDAAKAASVSLTTWRGLESGTNRMPTSQTLIRIAQALKLDSREFLRLAGRADEIADAARPPKPGVRIGRTHRHLASLLEADTLLQPRDRELLLLIYDFLAVGH